MKIQKHFPLDKDEPINFVGCRKLFKEKKLVVFCSNYSFNNAFNFVGQWIIKYKK